MGVLLHHERYKGSTPGCIAMLNSIFESLAEQGIRFSYLELSLFIMEKFEARQAKYGARTEDYEQFMETPYQPHSGAFLQEIHDGEGEDEWQTELDVWDEQASLDAVFFLHRTAPFVAGQAEKKNRIVECGWAGTVVQPLRQAGTHT